MAEFYRISGQYYKAEALYQRALAINELLYGPEHAEVALILHNMGLLCHVKGDYEKAESLYKRALAIREKVYGLEDISVGTTLNTLAGLYDLRGDYALAEPLYQRALKIDEKIYGTDHPDIAIDLKNLALLCHSHGDYAKAKPLYQRALSIEEKTYAFENDMIAMTLNHLGGIHYLLGSYEEAELSYRRALLIRKHLYGNDSPDIALILHNLGNLHFSLKQYDSAESHYCRALELAEIHYQPELKWRVLCALGQLLNKEKYHTIAIFFAKKGIHTLRGIHGDVSELEKRLKRFTLIDRKAVCKFLADMLMDQGRIPESQEIIAIMKAEEYTEFVNENTATSDTKSDSRLLSGLNDAEMVWDKGYEGIRGRLKTAGETDFGFFYFLQILKEGCRDEKSTWKTGSQNMP
jgi:tetratricopeptide (TPR) repeat protein